MKPEVTEAYNSIVKLLEENITCNGPTRDLIRGHLLCIRHELEPKTGTGNGNVVPFNKEPDAATPDPS